MPDTPKTGSRWRILVDLCVAFFVGWLMVTCLIDGEVSWGRANRHYSRSHDPVAYWCTIAFCLLALTVAIFSGWERLTQARKPHPKNERRGR